jgi:hypothetical protein
MSAHSPLHARSWPRCLPNVDGRVQGRRPPIWLSRQAGQGRGGDLCFYDPLSGVSGFAGAWLDPYVSEVRYEELTEARRVRFGI